MIAPEARPSRARRRWTLTLIAVAAIVGLGTTAAVMAIRRRPRTPTAVVLITIDTLRADFGRSGGVHTETPFLDRLGAAGVTFTAAYAASSWTVPSMASLFTSLPPSAHGVSGIWDTDRHRLQQHVLPASLTTLAERFQQGGYVTIGMPANLHLSHELGFAQGFDYYAGRAGFVDAPRLNNKVRLAFMRAFGRQWAHTWKRRPAFVWVHYFDPHFPYVAREPWISRYAPTDAGDRRTAAPPNTWAELVRHYAPADPAVTAQLLPLYASEISYLDDSLARLSDRLGLESDDVLLIVTADHGEEFGEHGGLGHGHGLHEELLRVPLLIRWPAGIPGGRRIDEPVTLLDIYPTLLELAGLPATPGALGRSLAGVLRGGGNPAPAPVFAELLPPRPHLQAARDDRWKLIRTDPAGPAQLFDVIADPSEQHDVARENPDVVARLDALLTTRTQSQPPAPPDAGTRIIDDPAARERLRAIGYGNP